MVHKTKTGRVTIPTDAEFVEGTKKFIKMLGADAVRDCDGTALPENAGQLAEKVYKTYFMSRGDNDFAYAKDEYMTNIALMSERFIACDDILKIDLLKGFFKDQIEPNNDDGLKYWQVIDRTTNQVIDNWEYADNIVTVYHAERMHEYTVNFFGKSLWNSTQIYNYTCNKWTKTKDRDYDLIFSEVLEHVLDNIDRWIKDNPQVNVLRFTTFLYHFFLIYKTGSSNKIFDWYNYAMAASPKMFELFRKEYGYEITLEDLVTNGSYSSQFQIPSKTVLDFMDLVQRVVADRVRKIVDKVHSYGKEVMMFWGDNWIGAEPYGKYFSNMNIDAVVGSVSSGVTVRMVSDIPNLKYKEIRLMPYFFPDTLYDDKISTQALVSNWITERRAIMRKPVDRIGFGGYLKLANKLPVFCEKLTDVCNEFREIYENVKDQDPYNVAKVAIMSYWGKEKTWMTNEFSQSASCPLNAGYMGILECLCGMPVDISFISFRDAINDGLNCYDVVINMGNEGTSFSGDSCWKNPVLVETVRNYVAGGGGFIGVGEPTAFREGSKFFQLSDVLGVDKEQDKTVMYIRTNEKIHKDHFILNDVENVIDYAGNHDYIYAKENAIVLDAVPNKYGNSNVMMAVNEYFKGRSFYVSGLAFNSENIRILLRAILWCSGKENMLKRAYSSDVNVECHYYQKSGQYALVNNADRCVSTDFYDINGNKKQYNIKSGEIIWIK